MWDRAVILLGYRTGLRGADIVTLKLSDIDWRRQCAKVVQTKTHKPLAVELNVAILNTLADFVLHARPQCGTPEVFVTMKAPYRRLSPAFVSMVDKYYLKAGVEKIPRRAFHSFRRSFETAMVSRGVPIETASQMMRHKGIEEDKPCITHDREKTSFVVMEFRDVPVMTGLYAGDGYPSGQEKEGTADDIRKSLLEVFEQMMSYRESAGYATATYWSSVPLFIDYCAENRRGSTVITQQMVDGWLASRPYSANFLQRKYSSMRHLGK